MTSYVWSRVLQSLISLIGLVILVFFLVRLTGSPADLYLPLDAPAELRHEFNEVNGFNDPLIVQFGRYVGQLVAFDFGTSVRQGRPTLTLIQESFPTTLLLALISMSIALAVAIVTGALAAWRPQGVFDRIASLISLAGASIPNFWVAIVGVIVFSVQLRWLPTSGTGTVLHWILPVTCLVIRPAGLIVQVVRSSMVSAFASSYVKTARAKGVSSLRIIFLHALRNAMLPVITVAGDQAAGIIAGAVVVETIFGFPGIGKLMIDSIFYRDFAVLQAAVLFTALVIFAMNIVIDVAYALLDPRIRYN